MPLKVPTFVSRAAATVWHMPGRALRAMLDAGSLAIWAQIGAGVAATLLLYWYGRAILYGPWPVSAAPNQLALLGQGQILSTILALVALTAVAGLRVAMKADKGGFDLTAERDDPDDHKTVVSTVIDEPATGAPTAETTVVRDGAEISQVPPRQET